MLYLTGSFNGKKYDQSVVSAQEVIDILGIQEPFKEKAIYFRIPKSQVRPDKDNEGVKIHRRPIINTHVNGAYKGSGFTLRYSKYAVNPTAEGRLIIPRTYLHFVTDPEWWMWTNDDDIEKTLMVFLSANNSSSPIRNKNTDDVYFESYIPTEEAKIALQANKARRDYIRSIEDALKADFEAVKQKAKGLDGTFAIGDIQNLTNDEFELRLLDLVERDTEGFKKQWIDTAVAERGLLQDAIDKKIIDCKPIDNILTWFWVETNDKITYVPQGSDARLKLREYFLNNQSTMLPLLENALKKENLDEKSRKTKK